MKRFKQPYESTGPNCHLENTSPNNNKIQTVSQMHTEHLQIDHFLQYRSSFNNF